MLDEQLFDEQMADTPASDKALVAAVAAGKIDYASVTPDEEAKLSKTMAQVAAETSDDLDAALVVTALRLPKGVLRRIGQVARAQGVKPGPLMRAWIEEALVKEVAPDGDVASEVDQIAVIAAHLARRLRAEAA